MAIKALKQNVSIREIQKMIHQWKAWGVSDSACLKLLDLYLGMPHFMNEDGVYPINNLYQICLALKTIHTSDILEYIKKCKSFELVWNENRTEILAFFTPLWHHQSTNSISAPVSPAVSPAETNSKTNINILYNINNIYPPEDSRKGYSAGNGVRNAEETDSRKTPSEIPAETPDGGKTSPAPSSATDFFHRLNATPKDKKQVLVPIINNIATSHHYTRPRALQGLVILVNQFLIPYFDSDPRFSRISHTGRIIWLQNLMKTRHGQSLMGQAIARLGSELNKDLEEKHRKLREFRPVSPFEWKESDKNIRYYDDPIDGKVEIPENAPPRPAETAIWNVLSKEWVDND